MAGTRYSIPEIKAQLEQVRDELIATVEAMPEDRFFEGSETDWSAADYLKHLILSVKPFAKAMGLSQDQLVRMFERPSAPSMTYEQLVDKYNTALAAGVRAQLVPTVLPVGYRMPEDVTDVRAYLLETWHDANQRLLTALDKWNEPDIDQSQMPHPAIGMMTLREMLYFTIHHNRIHTADIAKRGNLTPISSQD